MQPLAIPQLKVIDNPPSAGYFGFGYFYFYFSSHNPLERSLPGTRMT